MTVSMIRMCQTYLLILASIGVLVPCSLVIGSNSFSNFRKTIRPVDNSNNNNKLKSIIKMPEKYLCLKQVSQIVELACKNNKGGKGFPTLFFIH